MKGSLNVECRILNFESGKDLAIIPDFSCGVMQIPKK